MNKGNTAAAGPLWLSNRRGKLAAALVLLQVLVLIGVALSYYAISWYGQDVRVKTVPVDPRDLLYGDYVNLSYEISEISPALWKGSAEGVKRGQVVYVVVRTTPDGTSIPVGAYDRKPDLMSGETMMKGRASYQWEPLDWRLRVNYGIEKYYVPENTGKELEEKASDLIVHLKVSSWGQAKIEGLEER
ncbi:GDYXXLXY domain-containing protein [Paenibacillus puerhi]|uniref:GDYXXLXY domain-containing protein n=1 Tax=Paenibacillus puerhi TaxID=2692622 RepID=UPI0013572F45|nr:GDYXXLXY domain-containing protein [Paenibacillus puerhi]